jgi:glycosyltransferase involved in cell wall biosynthesis
MNCSLIICTYNWPQALSIVLSSVVEQTELPDEIIVADDGSDASTAKIIEIFSKKISIPIIHSWQEDKGCRIPHSRNRAIAKSSFEYIVMIDGDTVLHQDFIKEHKKYAHQGVYIQGSRVLLQPEFTKNLLEKNMFTKPSFFSNHSKNKLNMLHLPLISLLMSFFKSQNIARIRGCNFSLFKNEIIQVNGFNEDFPSWGREDSEFVQRLLNNGMSKQHLKFAGIQYHLYHKEGVHNNSNNDILENTIRRNLLKCNSGIDRYL